MRNLPICSRHYIKVFQITLVASRLGQFCENFENTREIIPLHPTESDVSVKRYPKNWMQKSWLQAQNDIYCGEIFTYRLQKVIRET